MGSALQVALEVDRRDDRLALGHLLDRPGQLGAYGGVPRPSSGSGSRPTTSPSRTSSTSSGRSLPSFSGAVPMPTTSASATPWSSRRRSANLRPPIEILSTLRFATETIAPPGPRGLHRATRPYTKPPRRVPAAGDELGADAVAVDGRGGERGDRVLVEVAGHHDPGLRRAQVVELLAHAVGQHAEVAGVEPDQRKLGAGDLHAGANPFPDVVGVDEQGRSAAERGHLGLESVDLGVVRQQREAVRARARARDAVPLAGREVGGAGEPRDVRRPGRRDGCLLVGASRPISMQGRSPAAIVIREAADAIAEGGCRSSSSVSRRTASAKVPSTISSGEYGKYASPSAYPHTSPEKR